MTFDPDTGEIFESAAPSANPGASPPPTSERACIAAGAVEPESPSNPSDGGDHDRGAVMASEAREATAAVAAPAAVKPVAAAALPTVTLDDGTKVVPATHLPPPSVMAMRSLQGRREYEDVLSSIPRARNRPASDKNFDFAQPSPDDAQIPQFLRRGGRG